MDELTIQELSQYFEDRIRQIDQRNMGYETRKGPCFPMLVVYLGDSSLQAHTPLTSSLLQVWPQYREEIKFIGAKLQKERLTFVKPDGGQALSGEEVADTVSALFSDKTHFQDRSKLLVYYILDTTEMKSLADLNEWFPYLREIKRSFGISSLDILDMLALLLNEDFKNQKLSLEIKTRLCDFGKDGSGMDCRNILLLSRRRSDNVILRDWTKCYQIIAAVIQLSNNSDTRVTSALFQKAILTASYAREEKPSDQIGQVVVSDLMDRLSESRSQRITSVNDETLPERLGINRDGCLEILNDYVDRFLTPALPTPEQLELFPRQDGDEHGDCADLSAKEFDSLTMGAWKCFLAEIVGQVREKAASDSALARDWKERYGAMLAGTFSSEELVYLREHLDQLAQRMADVKARFESTGVLETAATQLKCDLSSDPDLREIFLQAVREQAEAAEEYLRHWQELLRSYHIAFALEDQNLKAFYTKKVQDYFNWHGVELVKDFAAIHDMQELSRFFMATIDGIIESDPVFSASFEDELNSRLNADILGVDAKQYIRTKLTGDSAKTYLQVNFRLGQPLVSAILLKKGTALYQNLIANLPETTYYYDTGNASAAEAVVLYEVSVDNLING